jgi:hypothetical protein
MTGSDDDHTNTRPISVAELLARNGTIGAPPVGGRRRRRRGNADAVTVAELTGEIPIIRPDDPPPAEAVAEPEPEPEPEPEVVVEPDAELEDEAERADEAELEDGVELEAVDEAVDEAEADAEVELEADIEPAPEEPEPAATEETATEETVTEEAVAAKPKAPEPARRFGLGLFGRKSQPVDAEQWTPDPVEVDDTREIEDLDDEIAVSAASDTDRDLDKSLDRDLDEDLDEDLDKDTEAELPSYLRSTEEPLFGGPTVVGRETDTDRDADTDRDTDGVASEESLVERADMDDLDDLDEDERDEPRRMSSFVQGLWIVGQSIVAVIFGAGLFVAFDQLWKWNNIIALVLSVLVILGLVVGVRVVRKTEDIGSTLIAVAVGALVTLGPLALLQSG